MPTHVLRFWESRFTQVKPVKRAGGRRYYRPVDMELLGGIRRLLHDDGLTIRGVQKILRERGVAHVASLSPPLAPGDRNAPLSMSLGPSDAPVEAQIVSLHRSAASRSDRAAEGAFSAPGATGEHTKTDPESGDGSAADSSRASDDEGTDDHAVSGAGPSGVSGRDGEGPPAHGSGHAADPASIEDGEAGTGLRILAGGGDRVPHDDVKEATGTDGPDLIDAMSDDARDPDDGGRNGTPRFGAPAEDTVGSGAGSRASRDEAGRTGGKSANPFAEEAVEPSGKDAIRDDGGRRTEAIRSGPAGGRSPIPDARSDAGSRRPAATKGSKGSLDARAAAERLRALPKDVLAARTTDLSGIAARLRALGDRMADDVPPG